jgi:hypothetical protein
VSKEAQLQQSTLELMARVHTSLEVRKKAEVERDMQLREEMKAVSLCVSERQVGGACPPAAMAGRVPSEAGARA